MLIYHGFESCCSYLSSSKVFHGQVKFQYFKFTQISFLVPVPDGRRRHSYQAGAAGAGAGGAGALIRDMERLRVSGPEAGQQTPGARAGISPRPSKKRRASTRRSSRSGTFSLINMRKPS